MSQEPEPVTLKKINANDPDSNKGDNSPRFKSATPDKQSPAPQQQVAQQEKVEKVVFNNTTQNLKLVLPIEELMNDKEKAEKEKEKSSEQQPRQQDMMLSSRSK